MDELSRTWNSFCDGIDAHRRELAKIRRRSEKMHDEAAAAVRAYYTRQRGTLCAPGTEFAVNADRTMEVK